MQDIRWIPVAVFAVMIGATAAPGVSRADQLHEALALTPEHFRDTTTLKDDDLSVSATIDTSQGFQEKHGLLRVVWDDNFLRGFIDKKTGKLTAQVYQRMFYAGPWRFYERADYETPDGPVSEPLTIISRDVASCTTYGGCSEIEQFGFTVPEALLRTYAARYTPGGRAGWRFKYEAKNAEDWHSGLMSSEIKGFLMAVDAYRAAHGLGDGEAPAAQSSQPR
jgi:hypothetical protein